MKAIQPQIRMFAKSVVSSLDANDRERVLMQLKERQLYNTVLGRRYNSELLNYTERLLRR